MSWEHPLVLWALPVAGLLVAVLEWRVPGSRVRRIARFVARTAVIGCALAALAGPYGERTVERERRLVLAVDAAERSPYAEVRDATARALEERLRDIAAAESLTLDVVPYTTRPGSAEAPPPPSATSSLAAGLAAARLRFVGDETGGVVVLTDGHGELTGARAAVEALRADGIRVTGVAEPRTVTPRAPRPRIGALDVPTTVRGPFVVRATARDPTARAHDLVLRVDGAEVQRMARAAETPDDAAFETLELEPGVHEVSLTLEVDGVAEALARRLVEVGAPPEVVALFADRGEGPWAKALAAQGLAVAAIGRDDLAARLSSGRIPDLLLADAASLVALAPDAAHVLRGRVEDGLGLVVAAGGDPAAWAALGQGPLGGLLPVMPLEEPPKPPPKEPPPRADEPPPPPIDKPEEDESPGLKAERRPEEALPISLLLLVDRSGSMAGPIDKLNMAVLGAQRAAEALSDWDRVGVITFASDVQMAIPMRSARGASSIAAWLSGVEPDVMPGTDIAGALRMASKVLARERAPIKHVILLTDGRQYPSGPIFGPIVKPMRRQGITITAVGIGRGSHMPQLREIVQWAARGHVRAARTPAQIPRILTRDTERIAEQRRVDAEKIDARLNDEREQPKPPPKKEPAKQPPPLPPPVDPGPPADADEGPPAAEALPIVRMRAHEALAGFADADWPRVGRPRRAEPRRAGVVLLARQDGAPVLAATRAGLGRVLAWTVDPADDGALAWRPLGRLFAQVGRSALAPEGAFEYLPRPHVVQTPDGARLHVRWPPGASSGHVDAAWIGPDGTRRALGAFTPGDGDAGKPLPAAPEGSRCRIELALPGGPAPAPLSYLVDAGSELAPQPADVEALELALDAPLEDPAVFARSLATRTREERTPRWPIFLWLAVLLLPVDVFLHRRSAAP